MKKVTNEIKETMKELRQKGITFTGIGKILNLSSSTVRYHLDPVERQKAIERAKNNKNIWKGKKKWQSEHRAKRLETDEEFKERTNKHSREWWRRNNGK